MREERPFFVTNTFGQKLEKFRPLEPGRVRLYSCGPTVYSYAHIGNFRAYIFVDVLRRALEYNDYDVVHVRNITDVGHLTDDTLSTGADKIEAAARKENVTPQDIAEHYTEAFLRDARLLNLREPHFEPRATEYIEPIISLVERLVERGHAYPSDGNVYFEMSTFPRYGALSGNAVEDLIAGARVEVGEGKRNPADFALWKFAGPDKLMRWNSPWGEGVPGWHIECSAMSMKLLGDTLDIHTGGVDHIFPHHEDEIAQSEGATGKQFVRYWLHNEFLQLAGDEKMSKSVGNIYTLSDLIERGIHPLAFRYFTFQANYRTPLSFTFSAVEAAQTALMRIWEASAELVQTASPGQPTAATCAYRDRFHESINRDLDTPGALAILHEVLGSKLSPGEKLGLLADFDTVLGLDLIEQGRALSETTEAQEKLLRQRLAARNRKDWEDSDRLRQELAVHGLAVKDTPQGQRWVRTDVLPSVGRQSDRAAE